MTQTSNSTSKTDFFALWEEKNSKKKRVVFSSTNKTQDERVVVASSHFQIEPKKLKKSRNYTAEDKQRRDEIQKIKEELYLLATDKHQKVNKITREIYEKKRAEFLQIKEVLQAEIGTKRYTKAS